MVRVRATGATWTDLGMKYETLGLTVSSLALCSLEQPD